MQMREIWGQNETYILYILHSSCSKTFPRHWASGDTLVGALTLGVRQYILLSHLKTCFYVKI